MTPKLLCKIIGTIIAGGFGILLAIALSQKPQNIGVCILCAALTFSGKLIAERGEDWFF
jgi:hypothetical protein